MFKAIGLGELTEAGDLTCKMLDFEKCASFDKHVPDEIREFAQRQKTIPNAVFLHLIAVTASDFYGSNRNGDFFAEADLLGTQDPQEAAKNMPPFNGKQLPRYKTFLQASFYHHHKNKPHLGHDRFGLVSVAAYNHVMHRVELIIKVFEKNCSEDGIQYLGDPDTCEKARSGRSVCFSMGCFPPEQLVTMGDGTRTQISNVVIGDTVLTKSGEAKEVTDLNERTYWGDMVTLRTSKREAPKSTVDHLYWAAEGLESDLRWIKAGDIEKGYYLAKAINQNVETPDWMDHNTARILGYYLAEGHILRNKKKDPVGIQLTVHMDDAVINEIHDIYPGKVVIRGRANSFFAKSISIYNKKIAMLCEFHCGCYPKEKRLSFEIMNMDQDLQMQMIGAYINGDGHFSGAKQSLSVSTASVSLSEQIPQILLRSNIYSSLNILTHHHTGFNHFETTEHVIFIPKTYVHKLVGVTSKIPPEFNISVNQKKDVFRDEFYLSKVKEVTTDSYGGSVYNIEIADDPSYMASGFAVHNCKVPFDVCSITRRKNKGPADYGPYLKTMLGKTLPDGRKVYAINTKPRFFDISKVTVPADPLGFSIQKVASFAPVESSAVKGAEYERIAAAVKCATMEKKVPDSKLIGDVANMPNLQPHEDDLHGPTLDMMSTMPMERSLSNALAAGIVLKPEEFGKLAFARFQMSNDFMKEACSINWKESLDTDLLKEFSKQASARANYGSFPYDRMEKIAKVDPEILKKRINNDAVERLYRNFNQKLQGDVTLGRIIAILYKSYKDTIKSGTVDQFFTLLSKNPYILPASMLVGTVTKKQIDKELEKKASVMIRSAALFMSDENNEINDLKSPVEIDKIAVMKSINIDVLSSDVPLMMIDSMNQLMVSRLTNY